MFEYFRSFFDKVNNISSKVSNKDKSETKTVTFDSDGNVVDKSGGKYGNPSDGTPEEIRKLAKNLYEKIEKLGK